MIRKRHLLALCCLIAITIAGCDEGYMISQSEFWQAEDYQPTQMKKVAVVMYGSTGSRTAQRNKTVLEGLIIALQQRGIRVVEQQVIRLAQKEARMVLQKKSNMVSTREISEFLGKQLALDAVIYADAVARDSRFIFTSNTPGPDRQMVNSRQRDANAQGMITPRDAEDYTIEAMHNVGLSLHVVDVASGKLVMIGYRHLVMSQFYSDESPQAVSNFSAVQSLCTAVTRDILTAPGKISKKKGNQ
jgi:hypothetical protein